MKTQNMLSLAEVYFTDGNGNYRFQWSSNALICNFGKPNINDYYYEDDDEWDTEEYYRALAKYELIQKHLDDGSEKAASFRINIYDMKSGDVVYSNVVSTFEDEVNLIAGEYLWEVEALDSKGNVITVSSKAYINSCFDYWDDMIEIVEYSDSSAEHTVFECGDYIGEFNGDYYPRASAGKISTDGDKAKFIICCPAVIWGDDNAESEAIWNVAKKYGFMCSADSIDPAPEATSNCMVTRSGIYEYENGKWIYKLFIEEEFDVSGYMTGNDYLFTQEGPYAKNIYKYDTATDSVIKVLTAASDVYGISKYYYLTEDGVFNIDNRSQILKYDVCYGEHLLFDDMFFNVYAESTKGEPMDLLEAGEKGSIKVKYFFFDRKNNKIIQKEQLIFSGTSDMLYDTEEIFKTRFGNCITFIIEDESKNLEERSHTKYAIVHEITEDGSIKVHSFEFESQYYGGYICRFAVDGSGNLILTYYDDEYNIVTETFGGIKVSYDGFSAETTELYSGDSDGVTFKKLTGENFAVDYSTDKFKSFLRIETSDKSIDTYGLPEGTYQWQISADGNPPLPGKDIVSTKDTSDRILVSDADGNTDVFFAESNTKWSIFYNAEHQRIADIKQVNLAGKNRINNIFKGSDDANILVLTDDQNGDALFVDDIYSAFGEQARLQKIDEIRAGAGDDVIDFTSNRYEYIGNGTTIHGGDGNDIIWTGNGKNTIFGDKGNDQIIGGSNDDVIAGGAGNDTLHGGGGNDKFFFGGDFGNDTVEQLAGGTVKLYFEASENDVKISGRTYFVGANSVTLNGNFAVEIYYGGKEGSAHIGLYDDFTSQKVFESVEIPEDKIQYFGTKKFGSAYKDYSDEAFDKVLAAAFTSPLELTNGNDSAYANVNTWSYFESSMDFKGGNDTLIIPANGRNYAAAGVLVNGNINFGSGNNRLEVYAEAGGLYADNIIFGDGNNTVICKSSEIEPGTHSYYKGEHDYVFGNAGKIIFGDGSNHVVVDDGEFEGTSIDFGSGGNTVEIKNGGFFSTESYFSDSDNNYENWWNRIDENGGISRITFGSGADKIIISGKSAVTENGDEDDWGCMESFEIVTGGGNDEITLKKGGTIFLMSCVDDSYNMQGGNILMGDGDDTFKLEAGSMAEFMGVLDCGAGNDTLIIDGTLKIFSDYAFTDIENISGSGRVIIVSPYVSDDFISRLKSCGIEVIPGEY